MLFRSVSSALNLFASLGVTDSEFIDFVLDGADLAGRAFPQSPAWNGAVGLGWRDPGEVWTPHAPRLEDVYHAAIARAGFRDREAAA